MAAVQSVAQAVGVGFEGCQTDLALIHYFDMLFDIEDRRLQTVRLAAGERKRPTAFVLPNLDAEGLAVLLSFLDQLLRHIMVVNVDGFVWH